MKPLALLLAVMLAAGLCHQAYAQSTAQPDTIVGYLDKDLKPLKDPSKATAYCVAVRRDSVWETIYANMEDNRTLMHCYFKDQYLTILHGLYQNYQDDGKTLRVRGWYHNGKQVGVWKSWYLGGTLRDSVLYDNGDAVMVYRFTTSDSYPTKIASIRDLKRNFTRYFLYRNDGSMFKEFERIGKEEETKYYYSNGKVKRQIIKLDNKIISEKCFNETGERAECDGKDLAVSDIPMPEFPEGFGSFYYYMQEYLELPQDFTGKVKFTGKISFMLDGKGKAYDIKVIESSYAPLDASLRSLVRNMPRWNMKDYKKGYGPVVLPLSFNISEVISGMTDPKRYVEIQW